MSIKTSNKYALISVYDKTGIFELSRHLNDAGYTIIATGNTYNHLKESGNLSLKKIDEITNFPEILGGRVKTLHPSIFGGILSLRDNNNHLKDLKDNHINLIDFVAVNLYPFKEMKDKDISFEEKLEYIDIGGVSLLRAAAKNFKYVTVLSKPEQYAGVVSFLQNNQEVPEELKRIFASYVFRATSEYDNEIHDFLNLTASILEENKNESFLKKQIDIKLNKIENLRYGENPHQYAGFYKINRNHDKKGNFDNFEKISGKDISFNNLLDIDSGIDIIRDFYNEDKYFSAIIKHTNPCGAALSSLSLKDAFIKARKTDEISSFGGIICFNKPVNLDTALEIKPLFIEIVIAPDYELSALDILKSKKNTVIIKFSEFFMLQNGGLSYRSAAGGILIQNKDYKKDDVSLFKVVTKELPEQDRFEDLLFAWKIAKHTKSNAIVYVKDGATYGIGAGQMSRIDSAKFAHQKMLSAFGNNIEDFVMASDGFFPFKDSIEYAKEIGVTAIIEPGGSIRDNEVIEEANRSNICLVFTGVRHFKH